ncbi:TetR family transcriptional regulator [Terriglobus albidus]|uniref:TetR family transcriptional regulator n=1 Tax=Terriglobus albidus TaxID=1592106 RepID=A0A5B9EF20_9BACT|nr:TetR family transcriptional regulator [Terriglobus albidus]QEE30369.1 TetR family transcriptional regulator [Terriglobus albidus]
MAVQDAFPRNSLQAKKQEVVRGEIWNAAIDLFFEHGFDNVHVDQIASKAGVSRRTFFRYYGSKEDVMGATVKRYGEALAQAIRDQKAELSSLEAAKAAIKQVLAPTLHLTERVVQVAERSPAARMAQFLQVPLLEREVTWAFASRSKKAAKESALEHRILASLTMTATGMCVEIWVKDQRRAMPEIVDEVFTAIVHLFRAEDEKPKALKR